MQKIQYAVCPIGSDGSFVSSEIGVQFWITADKRNQSELANRRADQIAAAHGWATAPGRPNTALVIKRFTV